MIIEYMC